jgi:hypothetical protein
MARGEDTRYHQNRQVSRGFKPFGWVGGNEPTGIIDMSKQMGDTHKPVNVGSMYRGPLNSTYTAPLNRRSMYLGKNHVPIVESYVGIGPGSGMSIVDGDSSHRTRGGATRAAKKMIKSGEYSQKLEEAKAKYGDQY